MKEYDTRPTHLDLFSGIGGFALAAEWAGFRTVGFSEVDEYASKVLHRHWPLAPNYGDVRNVTGERVGAIDLVTAGFPCQPFSVAGDRRGDSDERFLWPECARVLSEIRPRFALFENVSGITTIDGGRTFNRILSDVSAVGYDCVWNHVPASAVGCLHRRERIWITAVNPHPYSLRPQRKRALEARAWSKQQLEGLVQNQLRLSIPAGKIGGVADGLPHRSHRLKGAGNAIVPHVAQIFISAIYELISTK
jgi:DNA (cytosine-5)-methyltransferase 1